MLIVFFRDWKLYAFYSRGDLLHIDLFLHEACVYLWTKVREITNTSDRALCLHVRISLDSLLGEVCKILLGKLAIYLLQLFNGESD